MPLTTGPQRLAWERLGIEGAGWDVALLSRYARVMVGPHEVRVHSRAGGVSLEILSAAMREWLEGATPEGAEFDGRWRVQVVLTQHGVYRIHAPMHTARSVAPMLRWLADQPASRIEPTTRPRIKRTGRRFGVEVEFFGISRQRAEDAIRSAGVMVDSGADWDPSAWRLKTDCSVTAAGLEAASPPLSGEEGIRQVEAVASALLRAGARVDRSCGLHVHVEVRDLGTEGIFRLATSWTDNQDLIDWLVQPSRRSATRNTYCSPLNDRDMTMLQSGAFSNLNRYRTLNASPFPRQGTVEVRQHGGTLDATKIRVWIEFVLAFVGAVAASPGATVQRPALGGLRGMLMRVLGADSNACAFLLGRAVAFGAPGQAIGLAAA